MRKTVALLLATAFVATLPTLASAKSKRHHRHHRAVVTQPFYQDNGGSHFLSSAIHQIFVPLEVTLGPRTN
jgi:hypothetical protein